MRFFERYIDGLNFINEFGYDFQQELLNKIKLSKTAPTLKKGLNLLAFNETYVVLETADEKLLAELGVYDHCIDHVAEKSIFLWFHTIGAISTITWEHLEIILKDSTKEVRANKPNRFINI